jgi:co-chaperonin GroES (HSP10)
MRAPTDYIIVSSDSRLDDTIKFGTLELYVPINEPNWTQAARTKMMVVGVSETTEEVNVGEMVWINFNSALNEANSVYNGDEIYIKVAAKGDRYVGDVYAAERDGKIVPVFDWVLVEPMVLSESSSMLIMPDQKSRKSENFGTIKYIGKNKIGLNVGDMVGFSDEDAFENDFNGEKLYTIKLDRILTTIEL